MKTFEAKVLIRNGNSQVPHTVRIQAQSTFAAQQMLSAQYGSNNLLSIPVEVKNSSSAPWIKHIGGI